jgi:hypothetical protein
MEKYYQYNRDPSQDLDVATMWHAELPPTRDIDNSGANFCH